MINKTYKLLLASTAVFSLIATSGAFATTNPLSPLSTSNIDNGGGSVVAAINALNQNMQLSLTDINHNLGKLALAKRRATNKRLYQFDTSLPQTIAINSMRSHLQLHQYPQAVGINAILNAQSQQKTSQQITSSLREISDSALTYSAPTPNVLNALGRIQYQSNLMNKLTLGTPASDTLYSDLFGIGSSSYSSGYSVTKPKKLYNDDFMFSSVFNPSAYTPGQRKAADAFVEYISKRYHSLTTGIDFGKLRSLLISLKGKPQKLAQVLHDFVSSTAFQSYQLSVRSLLASRSVALSNFNYLIAERTPIMTPHANTALAELSEAIGVRPYTTVITVRNPNNPTVTSKVKMFAYASKMQIENYVANHRVDSSQWYHQMAKASPATVQRETLFVLAQIESKLQQIHLDNERLLATISTSALNNSGLQQMMTRTKAIEINNLIKSLQSNYTPNPPKKMSGMKGNGTGSDKH